jgi:predicted nucleic acid-binding protein
VILADTSIWIDHLRSANQKIRQLLHEGRIVIHAVVIAELALGSLGERTTTLALLDFLPQAKVAQMSELRTMIETRRLNNRGIGLTDAHLIASVFLTPGTLLWTRDKPLRRTAEALGLHADLS